MKKIANDEISCYQKSLFRKWQFVSVLLLVFDVISIAFSYFFVLWIRFDCRYTEIPDKMFYSYITFLPFLILFSIIVYVLLKLYNSIWQFAGYSELLRCIIACIASGTFNAVFMTSFIYRMPLSYYTFAPLVQFVFSVGIRFSYRFVSMERQRLKSNSCDNAENYMLIGAGSAGKMIIKDINSCGKCNGKIRCIIDDDINKNGRYIDGIPVVGSREDILLNVEKFKIDHILVAIPSASADIKREILNICEETSCELSSLPGIYQMVNGNVTMQNMKKVAIEDLLGREPIKVDLNDIFNSIMGKVILVTGGGGSIGSELCRQIAAHNPKQLIIFDIYENNAYDIQQELLRRFPALNFVVLIGSVRDSRRIFSVFEKYKPDIVYHAAAHKHVPLMENSPCESIKNNVVGTYKTAYAALKNGCGKFVLISTDKAVNPTNIMGASKRICEMVIQSMDRVSKQNNEDILPFLHAHSDDNAFYPKSKNKFRTEFVAVRFGNVLGSNGSVVPLFKKQIENGGPVTVTHPDIIRYFMTIPEAVSLVLQAGVYAHGGEIFVLDMGEPVKIDTLAKNLIKLSGYQVDKDIKIVYTGLRPGEKLYEEKLMEEEGLQKTQNSLIHIGNPIPFDEKVFFGQLSVLAEASYENSENIIELVKEIVPTFNPEKQIIKKTALAAEVLIKTPEIKIESPVAVAAKSS